jgi:hypothetical protein
VSDNRLPQKNPLVKKTLSTIQSACLKHWLHEIPPIFSNGHKQDSTRPVQDYLANSWIKHTKFWGHQAMNRSHNYPIAMVSLMDCNGISIDPIDNQAHSCGKLNAIDTIPLTKHIFWVSSKTSYTINRKTRMVIIKNNKQY